MENYLCFMLLILPLTCDTSPYPVYFNLQNFGTDRQVQISEHIPPVIQLISLQNAFWIVESDNKPRYDRHSIQTESSIGGMVKKNCSVDSVLS